MAVDIIGKTINDLVQKNDLTNSTMFLCSQNAGTTTQYTTYKVAYDDIRATIVNSVTNVIKQIVNDEIGDRLDGYLAKTSAVSQTVNSPVDFYGTFNFGGNVQFYKSSGSDAAYSVRLPYNTYMASNQAKNQVPDSKNRVARIRDIDDKVQEAIENRVNNRKQILDVSNPGYNGYRECFIKTDNKYWYGNANTDADKIHGFYMYAGIRSEPDTGWGEIIPWVRSHGESDGTLIKSKSDGPGLILTEPYWDFESLTIVYVAESDPDKSQSGNNIHSVTVPVHDIDLARDYYLYKKTFHNDKPNTNRYLYYQNRTDRWFIGAAGHTSSTDYNDLYIDMNIYSSDPTVDWWGNEENRGKIIPIHLLHSFYFIAVFGNPR